MRSVKNGKKSAKPWLYKSHLPHHTSHFNLTIYLFGIKIYHIYIFFSHKKHINIVYIFIFLLFTKLACVCVCVCVCYSPNGYMVYHLYFSFSLIFLWVSLKCDPYNVCNIFYLFRADTGPAPTLIFYLLFLFMSMFFI